MRDSEVELLAGWTDAGAPEEHGNPPEPPPFNADWAVGEPNLVIRMTKAFTIRADGSDIYRNFPARIPTSEEKWVRAIGFHPTRERNSRESLNRPVPCRPASLTGQRMEGAIGACYACE